MAIDEIPGGRWVFDPVIWYPHPQTRKRQSIKKMVSPQRHRERRGSPR